MSKIGKWLRARKSLIFTAAVIAVLTAGFSLAWFTDSESAANTVTAGGVDIGIEENIDGLSKKNVTVEGIGDSPCYVRVLAEMPVLKADEKLVTPTVTYYSKDENRIEIVPGDDWNKGKISSSGKTIQVDAKLRGAYWEKHGDYWYLSTPLTKEDQAILCTEITYKDLVGQDGNLNLPNGITEDMLSVSIYAEAVQSDNIVSGEPGIKAAIEAFEKLGGTPVAP